MAAGIGRHLPKINAASAMKPTARRHIAGERRRKENRESRAPNPASAPLISTPAQRTRFTRTPAESSAGRMLAREPEPEPERVE